MAQTLYQVIYNEFKKNVETLEYDLETVEECEQCRNYLASLTFIAEEFLTDKQLTRLKKAADRMLDTRYPVPLWLTYRTRFVKQS